MCYLGDFSADDLCKSSRIDAAQIDFLKAVVLWVHYLSACRMQQCYGQHAADHRCPSHCRTSTFQDLSKHDLTRCPLACPGVRLPRLRYDELSPSLRNRVRYACFVPVRRFPSCLLFEFRQPNSFFAALAQTPTGVLLEHAEILSVPELE